MSALVFLLGIAGERLPDQLVELGLPRLRQRQRAVVTAEEAFELLDIDRTTGYKAIRDGTFPLPVLRIGRSIRIPAIALAELLGLDDETARGTN